jgi:hypothetical protein
MYPLLSFDAKFFIVGKPEDHGLFDKALSQSPFSNHRDKYLFRSYGQLEKMLLKARTYHRAYQGFFEEKLGQL